MAIVLICSKYSERTLKIRPSDLLEKAGHGKFNLVQLLDMEREVLQLLSFRIGLQD
ncbi:MAG: hypothetical protein RLZZ171_2433 [Cyanobacteriota bacterium]|jgi:hypothetical protein